MAGVMQSEYSCSRDTWESCRAKLPGLGFVLSEKGSISTNDLCLDIAHDQGQRGVLLAPIMRGSDRDNAETLRVEMHWCLNVPGRNGDSSAKLALLIEDLLTTNGATCTHCSVHEALGKRLQRKSAR